ncbi:MAG: hypothetical protein GX346_07015 [Clostridiales bacterium]|nr:hypothetical protein [Clostridiales bacterium]
MHSILEALANRISSELKLFPKVYIDFIPEQTGICIRFSDIDCYQCVNKDSVKSVKLILEIKNKDAKQAYIMGEKAYKLLQKGILAELDEVKALVLGCDSIPEISREESIVTLSLKARVLISREAFYD